MIRFVLCLFLLSATTFAQNNFVGRILDYTTNDPIPGCRVILKGTRLGAITDLNGKIILENIPDGNQTFIFSMTGFQTLEQTYYIPLDSSVIILLQPGDEELDEIIVEGTRSNKSIDNIPVRVEVLTEEIDEAATMDPSKIAHLITHSTGIQVQQTSATSNTANVRIQGLDGRYTQILRDGFPLYGGFSGSLSIMQIPPLDLRQVEYVKGGASTLYGGGAISGLINLLSKEPDKEETILHLNASHIGAFDVNTYFSRKIGKIGITLLGQRNAHRWFDADKDGFSDMPQLTKYNLNPKLFFYISDKTRLQIGATLTTETRQGGDTKLMEDQYPDSVHFYREMNNVNRITTQLKFDQKLGGKSTVTIKNSFNFFRRFLSVIPSSSLSEYRFSGNQLSSFSEFSYAFRVPRHVLIAGLNFYSDDFREDSLQSSGLRNEQMKTAGIFINYSGDFNQVISLEAGCRSDYVVNGESFILPRTAILFKWTKKLSTRIGGGMGYRNPTIFNPEAEVYGYRNILAVDKSALKAERSFGFNGDIGFKHPFGERFFINVNQMFFITRLELPLILADAGGGLLEFVNANGYTNSYGAETFFKFGFYDFVFFAGYTLTNVTTHFSGDVKYLTLTPRHSLKGDLLYALPGKWRIGLDYEFKSPQKLSSGTWSPSYWTFGAVAEYTWKVLTLFCNVENYTNVRQTNFGSLTSGPYATPQFTEVWAPLDGIVVNSGLKLKL